MSDLTTREFKQAIAGFIWGVIITFLVMVVILYPFAVTAMNSRVSASIAVNPCNACMEICNQY